MRTIIEVPKDVIRNLDQIGKQQHKSRAAIIREAISLYLEKTEVKGAEGAFGIWKDTGCDGIAYQEQVRSEWEN